MMEFVDDRTTEQKRTHPIVWMMTDRVLSGWGKADGGHSFAGWACRYEDENRVERWVRNRGDAMRVRFVSPKYRPPSGPGHCHIYVVTEGHAALR